MKQITFKPKERTMQIQSIFKKNITRPINGVVKADQLNENIIWQELDEYVITRELDKHLRDFLSSYIHSMDNPHDPVITERMGVWVSGFFGSGKSHFIKILSYLLSNRAAHHPESHEEKRAFDFFKSKINDPMLVGDIKRISGGDTDVILFNIDSRADSSEGRSTILSVFWRVFNEAQGFCGDSLYLAEIERYLAKNGQYDAFKAKFEEIYGARWEDERDAHTFIRDEIAEALSVALDKSMDATKEWFDRIEQDFNLTVENFVKKVKEYLDSKSKNHRIIFLVDEIGQFIGDDTHLMLNLQTIVEDLGRVCGGRAWVLVTSQEDIDSIIEDIKASKANDFSKIQGRFNTRLSLSSSNTDEVIQSRLLEKTEVAADLLKKLFDEKGDILKNQLSFSYDTSTLKNYKNADDFIDNYPFTPYHFQLVQKIFESIRNAGATGLHLSRGERSMLDAFQSAAISVSQKDIGALVPLCEFFPCIESFLDTAVKRSIDQAKENAGLDLPFDIRILQTLFLIRYVEIVKPNVDNLVTLCIDQVDADRLSLKRSIETSLQRLEKENLISRNGDLYYFLTNEEREVSREIKSINIPSGSETQLLGDLVFEEILKNKSKHRYLPFKRDYAFNRFCDRKPWGKWSEDDLGLEIISPLNDEYGLFSSSRCCLHSANSEGFVLMKLADDKDLITEIRTYIQTEKYIRDKSDASASASLKKILRDRADENRDRKNRLIVLAESVMQKADYFALGKSLDIKASTSVKAVEDALNYLIENTFRKFSYLCSIYEDPLKEIKHILLSDDITRQRLLDDLETKEDPDMKEVRTYIDLKTTSNHSFTVEDMISHFSRKPYGWPEFQIAVLIAKLFVAGTVNLMGDSKLSPTEAVSALSKTPQWKTVKILKRESLSKPDMQKAQSLGKELFGILAPDGQDPLKTYITDGLTNWKNTLRTYKSLADTGRYPGKKEIDHTLATVAGILSIHDSYELIKAFNTRKNDLIDASEDLHDLKDFYLNQKQTWETLRSAVDSFLPNRSAIEKKDAGAGAALERMIQILSHERPYKLLKDAATLIASVQTINDVVLQEEKTSAIHDIDNSVDRLAKMLNKHHADSDLKNAVLYPLQAIKKKMDDEKSVPQISYMVAETRDIFETGLEKIEQTFAPAKTASPEPEKIKTIKPSNLKTKPYLSTEDDVNQYIETLRNELMDAVNNHFRVKIV